MRALAIFVWLLAVSLAVLIVRGHEPATPTARVVQAATLELWRGAETVPSPIPAPSALSPAMPSAILSGACARLGIFPDQGWAESVAGRIATGEAGQAMSWRVQPVGRKGYYVVFEGMSLDMLAARMEQRRAQLSQLVSHVAVPERCAGPAK